MEAATAYAMNRINFLAATPAPHRSIISNSSSFSLPPWKWNPIKPRTSTLKGTTFLPVNRCSTKPNTNINNEQDQDPVAKDQSNPNSRSPQLSNSSSGKNPSPSSSSSSSQSGSHSRGLVFDLGCESSWDSSEIGNPVVKRFLSDDEERWYMWYYGGPGGENPSSDSIGMAVSSNGIHWERSPGPVMKCGTDWWAFDTLSIRPCEVLVMSSNKVRSSSAVYWLYYTGYSAERVKYSETSLEFSLENPERFCSGRESEDQIFRSLPGLAMSQDGRHWARIEGDHHSGALIDVGSDDEWDPLFIAGSKVVFHANGDLRMYYHSFDVEAGEFCIGIARSRDGIKWVKLGKVLGGRRGCFDEGGVVNAHVVRNNSKNGKFGYLMVYEGVGSDGKRSIGLAASSDGLKEWRRLGEEAILAPTEDGDSWDCVGVGSPYLVQLDGDENEWRLYYRGVGRGGRTGIGMAVSAGSDVASLRRWTGFHV